MSFKILIPIVLILLVSTVSAQTSYKNVNLERRMNQWTRTYDWFTSINQSDKSITAGNITTDNLEVINSPLPCTANKGMIYTNMTTSICSSNITDWYKYGDNTSYMVGNVGIGTTNPSEKLHLVGDMLFEASDGDTVNLNILTSDRLQVANGDFSLSGANLIMSSNRIINGGDNDVINIIGGSKGSNIRLHGSIHASNPNVTIFGTSVASPYNPSDYVESMRIDAQGNVGIGTTGPMDQLSVADATLPDIGLFNTGWAGSDEAIVRFRHGDGTGDGSGNGAQSEIRSFLPGGGDSDLRFYTTDSVTMNSNPTMVITGNGNVGIGNVNPQVKLDVEGTIEYDNIQQESDIRSKDDIKQINQALDKVTRLKGVSFKWNNANKDNKTHLGVIAQEVEKIFPEVVNTNSAGLKSVEYPNLIAPMIEAVKELKSEKDAEISRLKSEIQELKQSNENLGNSLALLTQRIQALEENE